MGFRWGHGRRIIWEKRTSVNTGSNFPNPSSGSSAQCIHSQLMCLGLSRVCPGPGKSTRIESRQHMQFDNPSDQCFEDLCLERSSRAM